MASVPVFICTFKIYINSRKLQSNSICFCLTAHLQTELYAQLLVKIIEEDVNLIKIETLVNHRLNFRTLKEAC